MSADLKRLCRQLSLQFHDLDLLREALTHRSAGPRNNERLEFLGDAALGFIIAQELFHRFPKAREGELSRMRASLVNQASLAQLARQLNLGDWLILGPGELKSGGFRRDSILSDALEAVIGAIVEDQGIEICHRWVVHLFSDRFSQLAAGHWGKDAKTRLQEFLQGRGLPLPRYELLSQSGPAHDQTFVVACYVEPLPQPFIAEGGSRKQAEQRAATIALEQLTQFLAKSS
ncbi:MAG TPA: ribonuclease III [Methylothermaceae bacterium]|nr:ribonuclease III [Methylothermaceae bacterium]